MSSPTQHSSNGINIKPEEEELICQKAREIARGVEFHMAMKSAIELGILDTISEANNLSASEVAAKISGCVNPNAPIFVECILSLLASFSVLKCELRSVNNGNGENGEEKVYSVEPVCKYFVTNKVDGSLGPMLCLRCDQVSLNMWSHLNDTIKGGGSAFEKAYGMQICDYAKKDQRFSKVFNKAMSDSTLIIMSKILDLYKGFENINVLVDVGGGTGASLQLITSKYPNIRGVNFDLPYVVAHAPNYPGVDHVAGDMFKKIPTGDAIFLKWILHNWSNEDCVRLLKKCWNSIPCKGMVIVMEKLLPFIPIDNLDSQITIMDNLVMYSTYCARERTIEEYKALALASGFSYCRPICSAHGNWIMEFHKD